MPLNARQTVELSYTKHMEQIEEKRQAVSENRLDMYNDEWNDILLARLQERVSDTTASTLNSYCHVRFNPLQSIIDEISDTYTEEPTRSFEGAGDEEMMEIYKRIDIDSIMEITNRYINLLNDAALYVVNKNGKIDVHILTPNVLTVFCDSDDPTKPVKVMIKRRKDPSKGYTPDNRYWVVWTEEQHYILEDSREIKAIEGNEEMINPWGRLPFVFGHRFKPVDNFWNTMRGNCLYEFTILINISSVMDDFTRFWNSFKTASATGSRVEVPENLINSPDHMLVVEGDDVSVNVLDFQVNLEQLNKDKETNLSLIEREYGIGASSYSDTQEKSGRALLIRNSKLKKMRTKQEKVMMSIELELFELIKHIDAIMTGKEKAPDELTMDLKFSEQETLVEPMEKLELQEKEISLDLADIVDVFMERNPQFKGNYEEAKAKLIEIHKSNNEFRQMRDSVISEMLNQQDEEQNSEIVEKKP